MPQPTSKPINFEQWQKAIGETARDVRPKNGITATELHRNCNLTRSTARYVLNKLVSAGRAKVITGKVRGQPADFYVLTKSRRSGRRR